MGENDLKQDIMNELFNLGVGKAASMLSEIINKKILLSVPKVEIVDAKTKDFKLNDYLPNVLDGTLMVSSISFEEQLTGIANLIFPADKMRSFINLCLNETDNLQSYDTDFTDIDFDVIKEIGNIILNCLIGEITNYLNINLSYTLPQVKIFQKIDFSKDIEGMGFKSVLILYISFVIDDAEIEGAILIDLTMNSLNELTKILDKVQGELDG